MMKSMMLRCAAIILLFSAYSSIAGALANDPQALVKQTTNKVLEALRTEGDALQEHPKRVYEIINELILPHFDFRQMSKWVLGRYWRQASESQRDAITEQFEHMLVRTYSHALVDYRDQTVDFLPSRERSATQVTVRAKINQAGGPPVKIAYEMHIVDDDWKVYDIAIEGVSLVINYRSSFAQEIKRNGIDGLIQRLAAKNKSDDS
jgi:phospholipid transport system substrate-binding protein